ncbi:MAG: dTDP-4-dehydrorhamnose reductase [Armatimonadota bacterium]|nr:dTDP-4-dehydrorhamnose reductase [Armatimonadota bacterium]MDR7518857.1 dTDP-4-dehydrorhamnose reductase [Armatimonadota bacterium]MDR7549086.1 dTDP-4-dehydrorhamnose reductase [Armatimonadota bacterium]
MDASSRPRVAVIGASGQLGADLIQAMRNWAPVGLTHADVEVADPAGVTAALEAVAPDVVINCAAFHRVDDCERQPEEAFRINALGARNVAMACARLGALAVYISTDYVFDGELGRPYTEADAPRPINTYGVSKLAGEHLTASCAPRHLIVRVSSLFGVAGASGKGGNFVETVIRKARAGETLRVVDDLVMSPTYTADAAAAIRGLVAAGATGVVHAANAGACSWFEFARAIFEELGWPVDLEPQSSAGLPAAARRPRNSSLESARLWARGRPQPPWRDALRRYLVAKGHLAPAARPG